jgi:FkbM family methyltransferase
MPRCSSERPRTKQLEVSALKRIVKSTARRLGLEVVRLRETVHAAQKRLLSHIDAPMILDVGANVGQSLSMYASVFPTSTIHSFEPSRGAFETLERLAESLPNTTAHRLALGDHEGEAILHSNPQLHYTNSLLPRPHGARRYYPQEAELVTEERVPLTTLDTFVASHSIGHVHILKLDVQGAEGMVLKGAEGILAQERVDLIKTEMMFVPHYDGGILFDELIRRLQDFGYSLFNLYEMVEGRNGQLRFGDGLFVAPRIRKDVIDAFSPEP